MSPCRAGWLASLHSKKVQSQFSPQFSLGGRTMSGGLMFAIVCGLLAIAYGGVTGMRIMSLPTGNDRMREIAAAVQQGAQAYLTRQYTTIAIVGAVLFVVIALGLHMPTAWGFLIGAVLSG